MFDFHFRQARFEFNSIVVVESDLKSQHLKDEQDFQVQVGSRAGVRQQNKVGVQWHL